MGMKTFTKRKKNEIKYNKEEEISEKIDKE